jgi:hypothetical protein
LVLKTSRQAGNGILNLKALKRTGSAYYVMQLRKLENILARYEGLQSTNMPYIRL